MIDVHSQEAIYAFPLATWNIHHTHNAFGGMVFVQEESKSRDCEHHNCLSYVAADHISRLERYAVESGI